MPLSLPLSDTTLAALKSSALRKPDRAAGLAILLAPAFVNDSRVWKHFDSASDGLPFEDILDDTTWSHSERILLQLGWSIYNGGADVNVWELMARLDASQLEIAIGAVRAYQHAARPVPPQPYRRSGGVSLVR